MPPPHHSSAVAPRALEPRQGSPAAPPAGSPTASAAAAAVVHVAGRSVGGSWEEAARSANSEEGTAVAGRRLLQPSRRFQASASNNTALLGVARGGLLTRGLLLLVRHLLLPRFLAPDCGLYISGGTRLTSRLSSPVHRPGHQRSELAGWSWKWSWTLCRPLRDEELFLRGNHSMKRVKARQERAEEHEGRAASPQAVSSFLLSRLGSFPLTSTPILKPTDASAAHQ